MPKTPLREVLGVVRGVVVVAEEEEEEGSARAAAAAFLTAFLEGRGGGISVEEVPDEGVANKDLRGDSSSSISGT